MWKWDNLEVGLLVTDLGTGVPTLKSLRTPVHAYFLDLLLTARHRAQLTQQQLADRLGKPQSFVAKYEGGERRLDVIEFLHLSQFLGIDAARTMRQLIKFKATEGKSARGKPAQGKAAGAGTKGATSREGSRGGRTGPGWRLDVGTPKK